MVKMRSFGVQRLHAPQAGNCWSIFTIPSTMKTEGLLILRRVILQAGHRSSNLTGLDGLKKHIQYVSLFSDKMFKCSCISMV